MDVIIGVHHLKIPVTDLTRSRAWYEQRLGLRVTTEFPDDDGVVRGVAGDIAGVGVALRVNEPAARGTAGFDPICFAVTTVDGYGVEPIQASQGQVVRLLDPDGIEIRLYTLPESQGLDGKRFRAVADVQGGEVEAETLFTYHELDGEIWAEYSGGRVRRGFLTGTRTGNRLDFRYTHLNTAGETSTGHCSSTVETLPDGRLRLRETWEWESRPGSGTSVLDEV